MVPPSSTTAQHHDLCACLKTYMPSVYGILFLTIESSLKTHCQLASICIGVGNMCMSYLSGSLVA